jgi:hypothetical protein
MAARHTGFVGDNTNKGETKAKIDANSMAIGTEINSSLSSPPAPP